MTMIRKAKWLHWINIISVLLSMTYLSACTTAGSAMPQDGETMAQVYEEAMQQSNVNDLNSTREQIAQSINYDGKTNLSGYTRTAENETNNLFHPLPNPELVMYVYPHLGNLTEAPIPGYSTAFSLYDKTYYAMPGDVY